MAKIHVLDKMVAELIAAGEVVERPASIVKELVENAIDAGATSVTVEIQGGGIQYLQVRDNGSGIEAEDIPRAFLRHATSKVRDAEDLIGIGTLGFRGEALCSIAAMCRVELLTKTAEDELGTLYRIEGGEVTEHAPAGCPNGTSITVRDVFFNTPARMKFLKRDTSEGNAVAQVVDKCALSHPEVAFRFVRDGQTKLRTGGKGDLLSAIRAVYGREFCEELTPVEYLYDGRVRVDGYVSKPSGTKASRVYQNFFINGRYVRTRTASAALEEAFKQKIMAGKFPACVLHLTIGADTVDVNVHPAKTEVRFVEEKPVFHAVFFAVKTALQGLDGPLEPGTPRRREPLNQITMHVDPVPPEQTRMSAQEFRAVLGAGNGDDPGFAKPVRLGSPSLDISVTEDRAPKTGNASPLSDGFRQRDFGKIFIQGETISTNGATIIKKDAQGAPDVETGEVAESPLEQEAAPPPERILTASPAPEEELRLLGEAFGTYVLLEQGDDLLLVDKHAAHERMLYEALRENLRYGNRQLLLTPLSVALSKEDYDAAVHGLQRFEDLGFLVEDFGDGTVLVRETPIELPTQDVVAIVEEIADRVRAGNRDLTPEALDRLYYSIACRSAIKAGDKNSPEELQELVERLRKNPSITHCPHGRPVTVRLHRRDVEKLFGRLV